MKSHKLNNERSKARKLLFFGKRGFEPEYQAILTAAEGKSYPLPTLARQGVQNQFVKSLKEAGIWDKFYFLYLVSGNDNVNFAGLDMANPATREWTLINSPTFVSNVKILGDGTSTSIDTNFNPVLHADSDFGNNNAFGAFQTEETVGAGINALISNTTADSRTEVGNDTDDTRILWWNHRTAASNQYTRVPQDGFLVSRSNASDSSDLLVDGVVLASDSNSSAPPRDGTFSLFSRDGSFNSDGGISIAFASKYLNDTEMNDFIDIYNTYKAAL